MKVFRTVISPKPSGRLIALNSAVFTAGSCFADVIGQRLSDYKIDTLVNPFGAIYNPIALHRLLASALEQRGLDSRDFIEREGVHAHYSLHSKFSGESEEVVREKATSLMNVSASSLKKANWIILTYGTAFAWYRKETRQMVANCHKQPASLFEKKLTSAEDIVQSFRTIQQQVQQVNPKVQWVLTVSPVRHLKDSLELNSVSKAILRTACHQICDGAENVQYFPAYEIMIDDLRDYRFYNRDMIHPSDEAEDYIWQHFVESLLDDTARDFIKEWTQIRSALQHKPFHPSSTSHQQFLINTLHKLEQLSKVTDTSSEIAAVKAQIV